MDLAGRILALVAHPGIGAVTVRRMATQLGGWDALAAAGDEQLVLLAQALIGKRATVSMASWEEAGRQAEIRLATIAAALARVLVPGSTD